MRLSAEPVKASGGRKLRIFWPSVSILFFIGCRSAPKDLVDTGTIQLELIPNQRGYYRDVDLQIVGQSIEVQGYVKRFLEPGHVRVQLLTENETLTAEDLVSVRRPPRSSRVRHAAFTAQMPVPPMPASVRIIHERSEPDADRKR